MKRWAVGFAVVVLVAVGQAEGAVLFNNFGPGDTYNTGTGWQVGFIGAIQGCGFEVTTPLDVTLDTIELAVSLIRGPNELDVALVSDAGGVPGAVIESFHFSDAMGFGLPPLLATSVLHPTLNADTQYWVIASVPTAVTRASWNWNSTGDIGPLVWAEGGGSWNVENDTRGALRVTGAAIPEPSTFALLSIASLLLTVGWWRRRRAA